MKKLLGIILVILFAFSIYFSINSDRTKNHSTSSTSYALGIQPPKPHKPVGC